MPSRRPLLLLVAAAASAAASAAAAAPSCTFVTSTDYAQGTAGPSSPATSPADCCAQCSAAPSTVCWAAVFDSTFSTCWFKTQEQTLQPTEDSQVTACWPPGRVPPSPGPSPSPQPALYQVSVVSKPALPVISFLQGQSAWPQSFNPAWVEASPATGGVSGLLVRSQNCTGWVPGQCQNCNVDGQHPLTPWFPGSVISFAKARGDGSFEQPYLVFAPEENAPTKETFGTEDPRLTFDPASQLYHLFYTCYGPPAILCHATSTDPTLPYPGAWHRFGAVFPGAWGSKSAALLLRPSLPHYLIWGAGHISLAVSNDLFNWTTVDEAYILPRQGFFDDLLVESGPSPLLLEDGNYIFFHNSMNTSKGYSGYGPYK
jgi:hypothetical protein